MIDIHAHILPGIDDGAQSIEEACAMAEMAVKSGVQKIITTPHSNDDYGFMNEESVYMRDTFEYFKDILKLENIPLELYRGMEIMSSLDIAEKILAGKLISLNKSRYILVEFPFDEEIWWFDSVLREIVRNGFIPIVAHPERYDCVQDCPDVVREWREIGAYLQMNKGCILGRFGYEAEKAASRLLRHNLYSFVASDAHHADIRTTDMWEVKRQLQAICGSYTTENLLYHNPLCVLNNRKIRFSY